MKLLVTGACGFVGSTLLRSFAERNPDWTLFGADNLIRPGSERNRGELKRFGVRLFHCDLRCQSDVDALPEATWVVDAAANASVLAGADGKTSSRQLMEHNLWGTINLLEFCKRHQAGFVLLSTSRVYSITPLAALPVEAVGGAFHPVEPSAWPAGLSAEGISERFETAAPISLYGATKLASESLALEYGGAFDFPVWINRCGVLAGAGQLGRPDQGIFAYWVNAHLRRKPLRYIGFGGLGHQVRDCLHPADLVPLLDLQFKAGMRGNQPPLVNVSGGVKSAMSLQQLNQWCDARFGELPIQGDPRPRPFDLPWVVLDNRLSGAAWGWSPRQGVLEVLDEIARHAELHPDWLAISSAD
jgi:CDP-paratose 2-epimerase